MSDNYKAPKSSHLEVPEPKLPPRPRNVTIALVLLSAALAIPALNALKALQDTNFQVAYLWPFARYVIFLALVAILIFLLARAKGWARPVLLILTLVGFAQVCTAVGMAWRRAPEMWEFLLSFPYLFGTVLPLVLNFVALHLLYFSSGKWFRRSVAGR
jgi:ABC-type xylose transport system permease subunit